MATLPSLQNLKVPGVDVKKPNLPKVPSLQNLKVPGVKVKKPNLPKTTKIDTVTGKGAPGGFKGASTKNPTKEALAVKGDISKLQAQKAGGLSQAQSQVAGAQSGAQSQVAGAQSQVAGAQSQASGLQSQATNLEEKRNLDRAIASKQTELKVANRAPNFSKGTVVTG